MLKRQRIAEFIMFVALVGLLLLASYFTSIHLTEKYLRPLWYAIALGLPAVYAGIHLGVQAKVKTHNTCSTRWVVASVIALLLTWLASASAILSIYQLTTRLAYEGDISLNAQVGAVLLGVALLMLAGLCLVRYKTRFTARWHCLLQALIFTYTSLLIISAGYVWLAMQLGGLTWRF